MALIVVAVLVGAVVFIVGILTRKRKLILIGAPAGATLRRLVLLSEFAT